jgi:hypothetical protein
VARWCGDTLPLSLDMSGTISLLFYLENIHPQLPRARLVWSILEVFGRTAECVAGEIASY